MYNYKPFVVETIQFMSRITHNVIFESLFNLTVRSKSQIYIYFVNMQKIMYTVLRLFEIRILNSNQTCHPFTHLLHDLDNAIVFPLQLFNYFIPLIWKIFLYINIRKMNVHIFPNERDSKISSCIILYSFHQNNRFPFTKSINHRNINTEILRIFQFPFQK